MQGLIRLTSFRKHSSLSQLLVFIFSVFGLNSSVSCNVDELVSLKNSLFSRITMSLQSAKDYWRSVTSPVS